MLKTLSSDLLSNLTHREATGGTDCNVVGATSSDVTLSKAKNIEKLSKFKKPDFAKANSTKTDFLISKTPKNFFYL